MIKNYKCQSCGKTVKSSKDGAPKCCGKPMKQLPLDICLQPSHAEHARPMEDDEPCDSGNAG